MLKYSFITNGSSKNEEVKYSEFFLSPDLSYISGVTSIDYSLSNNDYVNLSTLNYNGLYKTKIKIENVQRQGYVIYNKSYAILEYNLDGDITKYIIYNDGKIYYQSNDNIFLINGVKYSGNGNTVLIDTIYWVENMKLTIDGEEYEVDLNLTKTNGVYNTPLVKLANDTILSVIDYEYEKWHYVSKFIIDRDNNKELKIENITCADYYRYIEYGDAIYEVSNKDEVLIDGNVYSIYVSDNISKNLIDVDGTICDIKYGWRSAYSGQLLYIFIEDGTIIKQGDIIHITPMSGVESKVNVIDDVITNISYIIYNAKRYKIEKNLKKVVIIDDKQQEILTDDDGKTYITISNIKNYVEVVGDNCKRNTFVEENGKVIYKEVSEEIINYDGVIIDDKIYTISEENFIYNGKVELSKYIYIDSKILYKYKVEEVSSSNMLRCSLIGDYNLTSDEIVMESYAVSSTIFLNPNDYIFTIPNRMFGDNDITPKSGMGNNVLVPSAIADVLDPPLETILKIYKIVDYINLPIMFETNVANNLFQENILEHNFFDTECENAVNRIVDMERDIYVPVYKSVNNMIQNFPIINEIIFNLHFRTRDLETWKIIEDEGIKILDKDKKEIERPSNWFISDTPIYENLSDEDKFNMSDLLYFVDFIDDDVFYQKSKISKSFLRLSFYDSVDPKVQSLLHTSTVFLDEGDLYLKYINNINNGEFKNVIDDSKVVVDTNTISVSTEYSKNDEIIFDEEKRLSCRFSIKNRYEEKNSAEGFYLYLFKEYSTNLHERSIFMKVDFNHAGIGRTIPFMLPLTKEGEIETDIDNFKKGYSLSDIYKQMFIEIKVVYDEVNKRYVYYTPFVNNKPQLNFNLFEIKIKDE